MIWFIFRRFSSDFLLFSGGFPVIFFSVGFLVICCIFRRFSSDLFYFRRFSGDLLLFSGGFLLIFCYFQEVF